MAEDLEVKVKKAVLDIKKKVYRIYDVVKDLGMKLTHIIERRFDYHTLPEGIDYGS